ncbi:adenosylcobinamide-phosphate guanylyltransferase [Halogeometricum pallidum JCM 14848]|uniref:Adenosylcobinamide-phosphate guanylyltransferase n=1 Tax=Halogeometricum pallidum JCM 14848 TaxID=1227487 RepID=M0D536_HALPD|nr:NTP transferase domain-containing protein [Halogeometricum pallidum]ELZ29958.1 adenosylcobinamide-phosphate guanylyltransferase [Halogeometricum pallidum JCM 14848]
MCGGRGTRLGGETEKPLVEVCGAPMVERVAAALRESRVEEVYAAVSPAAPMTAERVRETGLAVVETPGEGYVEDLTAALDSIGRPVVTVAADLPLLSSEHVNGAIAASLGDGDDEDGGPRSVTVCVPADLKRRLGVSADTTFEREGEELAPTGLNVVADGADIVRLTCDDRLAVNVNRPTDLERAEEMCD